MNNNPPKKTKPLTPTLAIFSMPLAVLLLVSAHYELRITALEELHTAEHSRIVAEAESSLESAQRELRREIQGRNLDIRYLESRLAEAERELATHQARQNYYWEARHIISSLGLHDFGVPMLVHDDADMEIIDMLVEHFEALFSGDEQRFRATLSPTEWAEEFVMRRFYDYRDANYYRAEVKFIASSVHGYRLVFVLTQRYEDSEPALYAIHVAFNRDHGRWLVHDHH